MRYVYAAITGAIMGTLIGYIIGVLIFDVGLHGLWVFAIAGGFVGALSISGIADT